MPSGRTSTRLVLSGILGLLSFLMRPKNFFFGLVLCIESAASLSSSGSSDLDRTFSTSVLLRMVVEQLICPPMKNFSLPSASYNGAMHLIRTCEFNLHHPDKPTNVEQVPKGLSTFFVVQQKLHSLFSRIN